MGAFRLGQGLEPFRQFLKAFFARGFGHAWVHLRVFVGLAFNGRLEIRFGAPDGFSRGRVADFLQKIQVSEGMAGFGFGGVTEQAADVRVSFDIGATRKIQVPAIRLGFAGKRGFEIVMALCALESLAHSILFRKKCDDGMKRSR